MSQRRAFLWHIVNVNALNVAHGGTGTSIPALRSLCDCDSSADTIAPQDIDTPTQDSDESLHRDLSFVLRVLGGNLCFQLLRLRPPSVDEEGSNVEEDEEDEEDQISALGGGRMRPLAVLIRADKRSACPREVAAIAYATWSGWRRRARARGRKGAEFATRYREGSSKQTQTCMIMTDYTILRVPRSKLSHAERTAAGKALCANANANFNAGAQPGDGSIICSLRYRRRKPGGALEA